MFFSRRNIHSEYLTVSEAVSFLVYTARVSVTTPSFNSEVTLNMHKHDTLSATENPPQHSSDSTHNNSYLLHCTFQVDLYLSL